VLGSEGSVVPIFRRQIERGGPLTITHPDVVRFFMLVDEAVHLILHSSVLGEGGEIFLLDMGEPVRIIDLAIDMIRLSGFEPYSEIDIRVTGLRPGEKLYEELVTASEVALSTRHPKIMRLNEQSPRDWEALQVQILNLERFAHEEDAAHVREQLAAIVPEYQPALNGHPPHDEGGAPGTATSLAAMRKNPQRAAPTKMALSRQAG
jgi:FlaA1/EpsC-like NDP-sugar epimerase